MDHDLQSMSNEQLIDEVIKLREGIRKHRDSTLHDLCWFHPRLWGLLPEKTDPQPQVPTTERFLEGCKKFRSSLDEQLPFAPRIDVQFE